MDLLSLFRQIYDLDTIDTRFTTPSSVPYKTVIDARDDSVAAASKASKDSKERAPSIATTPAKWKTPEYIAYLIIIALAIPVLLYIPYDASRCTYVHCNTVKKKIMP